MSSGDVHRLLLSVYRECDFYAFLTRVLLLPVHYNESVSLVFLLNMCDVRDPVKVTAPLEAVLVLSPLHSSRTIGRLVHHFLIGSIVLCKLPVATNRWTNVSFLQVPLAEALADAGLLAISAPILLSRCVQDVLVLSKTSAVVAGQLSNVVPFFGCIFYAFVQPISNLWYVTLWPGK